MTGITDADIDHVMAVAELGGSTYMHKMLKAIEPVDMMSRALAGTADGKAVRY